MWPVNDAHGRCGVSGDAHRAAMSDQDARSSTRPADRPWNHRLVESEKRWTYQWGGHISHLLLKRGKYYVKFAHEESWKPVDMPSSDRWLYRDGRWMNLASATHYNYLGLWKDFAFSVLPQIGVMIEDQLNSQSLTPILGCTNKYGDVGNKVYNLVVTVALQYRVYCGFGWLHHLESYLEHCAYEGRCYWLKWVMGTRQTAGADPAWLACAEAVDGLSVFVYEFWNSNLCRNVYDKLTMCNKIVEACCLTDDLLETQVAARVESLRRIDLALRSSVGKRLVVVIHAFTTAPLSRCGASGSRSLATVHNT